MTTVTTLGYRNMIFLFLIMFVFSSCSKDNNNEFLGDNKVFLLTNHIQSVKNNGEDELLIDVQLVTALKQDLHLEFELVNHLFEENALLEIDPPTLIFKAGEKKKQLKIKSLPNVPLVNSQEVILQLRANPAAPTLEAPLRITVFPMTAIEQLSQKQIALLDGYKEAGLDLYPLMGNIPVESKVFFPGGGNLISLYQKKELTIQGNTLITLSEHATATKPVLKMVSNAMGIENYLYNLFRQNTIDDKEYWNNDSPLAPPSPKKIMELVGLSQSSSEVFEVALDSIEIDLKTKKVSYTSHKTIDSSPFQHVGFTYSYSAWDRLKKLLDANNPIAVEHSSMGGSIDPAIYLDNENISMDEYAVQDGNWKPASATLDDKTLSFEFPLGHYNMADYIFFSIQYKIK